MYLPEKTVVLKNNTPCILRSPKKEDAKEALAYLEKVCGQTMFLLRYPQEVTFTLEEEEILLERFSQNPSGLMIMAFIDGEVAALASFSSSPLIKTRHRASLAISVDEKYWGLGLGTHVIHQLCQSAKEIGITQMELEYVESHQRGRALYEKCGFIEYGRRPNSIYLKQGPLLAEVLMLKPL